MLLTDKVLLLCLDSILNLLFLNKNAEFKAPSLKCALALRALRLGSKTESESLPKPEGFYCANLRSSKLVSQPMSLMLHKTHNSWVREKQCYYSQQKQ